MAKLPIEARRGFFIHKFENGGKPDVYRVVTFGDIFRLEREVVDYLWWFPFVKTKRWTHVRFFPEYQAAADFVREELETYAKWLNARVVL